MNFEAAEKKLYLALEAYRVGRMHESIRLLKEVVSEAPQDETRFMASRELAVMFSKLATESNQQAYLTPGTTENKEFQKYIDIALSLYPSMPKNAQETMPVDNLRALKDVFKNQPGTTTKGNLKKDSPPIATHSSNGCLIAFVIIAVIAVVCVSSMWSSLSNWSSSPSSSTTTSSSSPKMARVIKNRATLRPQANEQNKPLMTLKQNEELQLLSTEYSGRGWYNVKHVASGTTGWIHGNNIEFIR